MKCLKPTIAWKHGTHYDKNGKLKNTIIFSSTEAMKRMTLQQMESKAIAIPCGKCVACLKAKRQEQSLRIIHEIEQHEDNCFITLTYNNENLPLTDGKTVIRGIDDAPDNFHPTLSVEDYQKWLKRFRKKLSQQGKKIRYFIVGEYGAKGQRPHYHAIIFGWKPDDLIEHKFCKSYWTYRSKFIESTWSLGFSEVGINVNQGVAKYCAQYVTKKFVKHDRPAFIVNEFVRASKMNGGLGSAFLHKFYKQITEQGYVMSFNRRTGQGFKNKIPIYYLRLLEKYYPSDYDKLQSNKECYLESVKIQNSKMTMYDWIEYFETIYQKVKYYEEMQKREVRRFEEPDKLVS